MRGAIAHGHLPNAHHGLHVRREAQFLQAHLAYIRAPAPAAAASAAMSPFGFTRLLEMRPPSGTLNPFTTPPAANTSASGLRRPPHEPLSGRILKASQERPTHILDHDTQAASLHRNNPRRNRGLCMRT